MRRPDLLLRPAPPADRLREETPDEIRKLANLRSVLDRITPTQLWAFILVTCALLFSKIILIQLGYMEPIR